MESESKGTPPMSRRDFQKLAMAALGGLVAGAGVLEAAEGQPARQLRYGR